MIVPECGSVVSQSAWPAKFRRRVIFHLLWEVSELICYAGKHVALLGALCRICGIVVSLRTVVLPCFWWERRCLRESNI